MDVSLMHHARPSTCHVDDHKGSAAHVLADSEVGIGDASRDGHIAGIAFFVVLDDGTVHQQ